MAKERSPLFDAIIGKIQLLQKFIATRNAVRADPSLSYVKDNQHKLLGPWKFNAVEVAIAGSPGAIIVAIASFISPDLPVEYPDPRIGRILVRQEQLLGFIYPFLFALSVTLSAYVYAWFSFFSKDRTHKKVKTTMRQFLYFDGSHGLIHQAAIGLWFAVTSPVVLQQLFDDADQARFVGIFAVINTGVLLVLAGWGIRLMTRISHKISQLHGYLDKDGKGIAPAFLMIFVAPWVTILTMSILYFIVQFGALYISILFG